MTLRLGMTGYTMAWHGTIPTAFIGLWEYGAWVHLLPFNPIFAPSKHQHNDTTTQPHNWTQLSHSQLATHCCPIPDPASQPHIVTAHTTVPRTQPLKSCYPSTHSSQQNDTMSEFNKYTISSAFQSPRYCVFVKLRQRAVTSRLAY